MYLGDYPSEYAPDYCTEDFGDDVSFREILESSAAAFLDFWEMGLVDG